MSHPQQQQQQSPPPAYSIQRPIATLTRAKPRSLRIVVAVFAWVGCIWAIIWARQRLKYTSQSGETSSMRVFDLILGIIYIVVAAIELLGIVASSTNKVRPMRLYAFASSGTVLLAATGGIIAIVEDLVTKQALINQCTTTATGETIYSGYLGSVGSEQTLTAAQAKSYCTSAWKKTMWYDVIWLVAAVFFASVLSLFSFACSRQLANPHLYATPTSNMATPMAVLNPHQYHANGSSTAVPLQAATGAAPDYVPPYPGPPEGSTDRDAYGYDTKPSSTVDGSFVPHSAEDAAWERSLADSERREWEQHRLNQRTAAAAEEDEEGDDDHGVFLGRSTRRPDGEPVAGRGGGGRGGHEEEEAAWEEARRNAGTAHLHGVQNPFLQRRDVEREGLDDASAVPDEPRRGGIV